MTRDDLWEHLLSLASRPATPGDTEIDRRQVILNRSQYDFICDTLAGYDNRCSTDPRDPRSDAEMVGRDPIFRYHMIGKIWLPALLMIAGLSIVTLPVEKLPSLEWRFHFGVAEMCLGMLSGIALKISRPAWAQWPF